MHALIREEIELPALPSASGVEVVGEMVYVIGDDSPLLYQLDAATLAAGPPTPLFEATQFATGRIAKHHKPDLECLTALPLPTGETGLLVLGSGATPRREQGYWVPLTAAGTPRRGAVVPLALGALYAALRPHLSAGVGLNLEGAAATDTELLLFQRTVGAAAGNVVFRLPLADTVAYLLQAGAPLPAVGALVVALPMLEGRPAGFSGATWYAGQLVVTASVEDTLDAVLDGAVLGSFVGLLALPGPEAESGPAVRLTQLTWSDGRPYRGKVESVAVGQHAADGVLELLLVTDDDAGGSTALRVELTI